MVVSWFLAQLQFVLVRSITKGVSIAFGDKKQPEYLTSKEFFDMAPRFDATISEEADDGR